MGNDDPATSSEALPAIRFDANGLVPVVAQQWDTGEVLMLAWMDEPALSQTIATGLATYHSRSRHEQWVKGATSGNLQYVRRVSVDCDSDAVLLQVDQVGVACHTGSRSCFDTSTLELPASRPNSPAARPGPNASRSGQDAPGGNAGGIAQ